MWKYTVKGWGAVIGADDDVLDFAAKRDRLVALLLESDWYRDQGDDDDEREYSELGQMIQDLRDSPTDSDADQVLWEIYNLADDARAWLDPDQ